MWYFKGFFWVLFFFPELGSCKLFA
jgi:hypothetical protein